MILASYEEKEASTVGGTNQSNRSIENMERDNIPYFDRMEAQMIRNDVMFSEVSSSNNETYYGF